MKRLKAIILMVVFVMGITACGNEKYADSKKGDNIDKKVYELQMLLDNDKEGNRSSVYWDGTKAYMISDDYDDLNISDGRFSRGYVPLEKELWVCNIYGMDDKEIIYDTDDHVLYMGNDWRFEVKRLENYATGLEALKKEKWLCLMGETQDDAGYSKRAFFRGVRTISDKNYAGYVICYRDAYGHSYEYSYMCIGNMSDCGVMINQLISQFDINFDVLEWIKEHKYDEEETCLNG